MDKRSQETVKGADMRTMMKNEDQWNFLDYMYLKKNNNKNKTI